MYAVIDMIDGAEALAYLVSNKNSAADLSSDGGRIVRLRTGHGIRCNAAGIPLDDDGTLAVSVALREKIRPYEIP